MSAICDQCGSLVDRVYTHGGREICGPCIDDDQDITSSDDLEEEVANLREYASDLTRLNTVFNSEMFFELQRYSMDQFGFVYTDEWRREHGGWWWRVGLNIGGSVKWFTDRDRSKAIDQAYAFILSALPSAA